MVLLSNQISDTIYNVHIVLIVIVLKCTKEARCSSVVEHHSVVEYHSVVEHQVMVQWVVGSIPHGGPIRVIFLSNQSSTTGVTKAIECAILSVGWCI